MIRGVGERRAHRIAGGNRGRREWMWNMELGWERIGAGGMQHSNNGAVLGSLSSCSCGDGQVEVVAQRISISCGLGHCAVGLRGLTHAF